MSEASLWWIFAAVAVGVELLTMSFYLLMVALGLGAAALAAHAGASVQVQLLVAAVVGGGAVLAWHFYRAKHPRATKATANTDVNMDVGATVEVGTWANDGTATVRYRGAQWQAALADGAHATSGNFKVAEVVGSRLLLVNA